MNALTVVPRRKRVAAGSLVVAALAVALIALLSGGGQPAHSIQQPAVGHNAFVALRSGPVATIDNPQINRTLTQAAAGAPVVVHAGSSVGDVDTHLVQAGTYICLVTVQNDSSSIGGYGCSQDAAGYAADDLAATVTFVNDGYAVTGATPDGTHDVTVSTADGDQPATVANSTFTAVVKSTPTAVNWVDAGGAAHHHALTNPDVKPQH